VHGRDRHAARHAQQPQVEAADGADEQTQADEVQALGDRPRPVGPHQRGHRRMLFDEVDEPDLRGVHQALSRW
jgi:hypothetical protein